MSPIRNILERKFLKPFILSIPKPVNPWLGRTIEARAVINDHPAVKVLNAHAHYSLSQSYLRGNNKEKIRQNLYLWKEHQKRAAELGLGAAYYTLAMTEGGDTPSSFELFRRSQMLKDDLGKLAVARFLAVKK